MINLITGAPGSGKTSYALQFMRAETKRSRRLYVHGVPNLRIPHIKCLCISLSCDVCTSLSKDEKVKAYPACEWPDFAEDGAVFFFDECQNIWRPRSASSIAPDNVKSLEVHRHRGLDFYLITQSPRLIDSNVRQLVSRHIHLKSTWARRLQYEWPECSANVQSTSTAIKSTYTLDKNTFRLYKSASLHTKQKRKIPAALFFLLLCLFSLFFLFFYFKGSFSEKVQPAPTVQPSKPVEQFKLKSIVDDDFDRFDRRPRVPGVLESAPIYDTVVQVVDYPKLLGCMSARNQCRCYTQQMTEYPMSLSSCLDYISGAYSAFNPYEKSLSAQGRAQE